MDADELQNWFREQRELRLGKEMSKYVLNKCQSRDASVHAIAILGADARTGRAVAEMISTDVIRAAFAQIHT